MTRRGVRTVLGVLWILDGLLQLQRSMFTKTFANEVLDPAGQGQPWLISHPVTLTAHMIAIHPVPWDLAFAAIQLGLGIGFLLPRLVRPALVASIAWACGVWWLGEGLGGLAGGHADLLTGAPGAVVLYAVLAIAVWPRNGKDGTEYGPLPGWLAIAWAALWIGGAGLRLLPGQGSSGAIASEISTSASSSPGWLAHIDNLVAGAVSPLGSGLVVAWVLVCVAIGLGGLRAGVMRSAAAVAGILCAAAFWVVGESFGQPWAGTATDPNSAPLIVLMAFALVGVGAAAPAYGRHRRHSAAATVGPTPRRRPGAVPLRRPAVTARNADYAYAATDVFPDGRQLHTEWDRSADRQLPARAPAPVVAPATTAPTELEPIPVRR
jgi:hypothetical protein